MADSGMAYDPDRLPWLTEDRKPRRQVSRTNWLPWALLAALVLAAGSYWLGMQTASQSDDFAGPARNSPVATVTLPQPAVVEPQVNPAPMPDVQPVAEPAPVRMAQAAPARRKAIATRRAYAKPRARPVSHLARVRAAQVKAPATVRRAAPMPVWPAAVSEGAYGRVVRIGAYGSRRAAKLGWWKIVSKYPGMRRLKAVVAPVQLPSGRIYYRLQFGTTSQAHSEVLCQRMRVIARTCAVIGLPKR
ncbi:MAG: hypothetical protein ABIT68_02160 [Sphingomicrobium sp.]